MKNKCADLEYCRELEERGLILDTEHFYRKTTGRLVRNRINKDKHYYYISAPDTDELLQVMPEMIFHNEDEYTLQINLSEGRLFHVDYKGFVSDR